MGMLSKELPKMFKGRFLGFESFDDYIHIGCKRMTASERIAGESWNGNREQVEQMMKWQRENRERERERERQERIFVNKKKFWFIYDR